MSTATIFYATLLSLAAAVMGADSAPVADPQMPPGIVPTVTREMKNAGGLFFGQAPDPARTRHYFIAAEPELWNFSPEITEAICGTPQPASVERNHQTVTKLRYVQYTDATFTAKVMPTARLGILGPVLRGVVGDYLSITFLNRTPQPLSMHPHGVRYDKDSEGSYYPPNPGLGSAVAPGATFTYIWQLDEDSGPLPGEPSSKAWLYHSHVSGDNEVNFGLVGCIIVTDPKRARPDGTPQDVDREMATLYLIFDESGLDAEAKEAYEYVNLPGGPPVKTWAETMELLEVSARYAINGRTFGNLQGLDMNEGERVRWYLFALGSEQDFHTAHWHGMTVVEEGRRRTDVVELLPATMKVADMRAKNPGSWLLHCHVAEHMMEGMFARYTIHAKGTDAVSNDPAVAFLGLESARQSLEIRRAERTGDQTLELAGRVTVFDAFSVFNQSIAVTLAGKTLRFNPDRTGYAEVSGSTFKIRNVNPYGVVYGGALEFEFKLQGEVVPASLEKGDLEVALQVGDAAHRTTAHVQAQARSGP